MEPSIDFQIAEYKRCAKDFVYFCENYVKISHPSRGMVPFKLYEYQKKVYECYKTHRLNIIKKFRQGGISTETAIYCAWRAIFHKTENTTLYVSKSDREAKNTGKIIDKLVENLPDWLRPEMPQNVHDKIFPASGGAVYFYTVKAGRSRSVANLVIDEAAFIKTMEDDWADLYPIVSAGNGKVMMISTPNGMHNLYATLWHKAIIGEGNFNAIELDVSEHPAYRDEKWLKEQRDQLGEKRFGQEVLGRFLSPGDTWLPTNLISDLDVTARENPPKFKRFPQWDSSKDEEKGALWVWEKPIHGQDYIISVDTGEGNLEGDYSAAQIISAVTNEQVAEFYSNTIPPFEFAQLLSELGEAYNSALIAVEKQGPGIAVLEQLEKRLFYRHLYGEKRGGAKFKYGFDMNSQKRQSAMDALHATILNKTIKIKSYRLVKEFNTFIFNPTRKRPEAGGKGNHDDLILSMAMGILIKNDLYPSIQNYEQVNEPVKNIFDRSTKDIIRQELEDMYLLGETKENNLTFIYGSTFDTPDKIALSSTEDINSEAGKQEFMNRPGHSVLSEFGW